MELGPESVGRLSIYENHGSKLSNPWKKLWFGGGLERMERRPFRLFRIPLVSSVSLALKNGTYRNPLSDVRSDSAAGIPLQDQKSEGIRSRT
jgi:hypothetical protein